MFSCIQAPLIGCFSTASQDITRWSAKQQPESGCESNSFSSSISFGLSKAVCLHLNMREVALKGAMECRQLTRTSSGSTPGPRVADVSFVFHETQVPEDHLSGGNTVRVRLHVRLMGLPHIQGVAHFLGTSSPDAPHAACPECGTMRVKRLARRDRIDRMADVPWSTIQHHLGGKLFRCALCRLQFYDCRTQAPDPVDFLPGPTTALTVVKPYAQTQ
jgi:hypothetical protein